MKINKLTYLVVLLLWATSSSGQSLRLPFFDDFSTVKQTPSPSRWVAGNNVYVNNTLTIDQPSINVATFDGLRANGQPFSLNSENDEGGTDTLTSLPIDLGGLTVGNAVALSFYWQRRGLGELPDVTDSLVVDFKGSDGRWRRVWWQTGGVISANFAQQFIPVDNAVYFHPAFQFRVRTWGRQSGSFDSWHVDYVYLNRGRTALNAPLPDRAVVQPATPLLRRYTAMPLGQFLVKPAAELADSVRSDFRNLDARVAPTFGVVPINCWFTIRDRVSGQVFQNDTLPRLINALGLSRNTLAFKPKLPTGLQGRATLQASFSLVTNERTIPNVPGLDLSLNDTLSGTTVLDDYYAYDDGTAETVKQINQRLARVAVRFVINKPDAVKAVRLNIAPTRRDQRGQAILLGIYAEENGLPAARPTTQQSFSIAYATERNGFTEFRFEQPVNISDSVFYVAYSQLDDPAIPVGFDRNSPFRNKLYTNLGTRWDRVTDQDGALLLRPVMNNGPVEVVTATELDVPALLFPNPTAGTINWGGSLLGSVRLDVLDLGGRTVQTMPLSPQQTTADLGQLPDGFYLLRFTGSDARQRTRKLIVKHE